MCGTVGFVPVGVEGQLHPQPPDGREDHHEAGQYAEGQVILQSARELRDRSGEHQVKEELEPAGTAFIQVVTVGGAQRRRVEVKGVDNGRMRWAGRGSGARSPSHRGPAGPRRAFCFLSLVAVASEIRSPRQPSVRQLWFPLTLRARCGGLGRARRRLTRGLRPLIWRAEYQPDGGADDGNEHHRHEKDVEPKPKHVRLRSRNAARGEALVTRGRPSCLTDSTLGGERQRQIGYAYGDWKPGHVDQNRSIRITTEPRPQTRQRGREWRAPGRRPGPAVISSEETTFPLVGAVQGAVDRRDGAFSCDGGAGGAGRYRGPESGAAW